MAVCPPKIIASVLGGSWNIALLGVGVGGGGLSGAVEMWMDEDGGVDAKMIVKVMTRSEFSNRW